MITLAIALIALWIETLILVALVYIFRVPLARRFHHAPHPHAEDDGSMPENEWMEVGQTMVKMHSKLLHQVESFEKQCEADDANEELKAERQRIIEAIETIRASAQALAKEQRLTPQSHEKLLKLYASTLDSPA